MRYIDGRRKNVQHDLKQRAEEGDKIVKQSTCQLAGSLEP